MVEAAAPINATQKAFKFLGMDDKGNNGQIEKKEWYQFGKEEEGYNSAIDQDHNGIVTEKEAWYYIGTLSPQKMIEGKFLYEEVMSSSDSPLEIRRIAAKNYARTILFPRLNDQRTLVAAFRSLLAEGFDPVPLRNSLSKVAGSLAECTKAMLNSLKKGEGVLAPIENPFQSPQRALFSHYALAIAAGNLEEVTRSLGELEPFITKKNYFEMDFLIEDTVRFAASTAVIKKDKKTLDFALSIIEKYQKMHGSFIDDSLIPETIGAAMRLGCDLNDRSILDKARKLSEDKKLFPNKEKQDAVKKRMADMLVKKGIETRNPSLVAAGAEIALTISTKGLPEEAASALANAAMGLSYFPNQKDAIKTLFEKALKLVGRSSDGIYLPSVLGGSDHTFFNPFGRTYNTIHIYACMAIAALNYGDHKFLEKYIENIDNAKTVPELSLVQSTKFAKVEAYTGIADALLKTGGDHSSAFNLYQKALEQVNSESRGMNFGESNYAFFNLIYKIALSGLKPSEKADLYGKIYFKLEDASKEWERYYKDNPKKEEILAGDFMVYRSNENISLILTLLILARIDNHQDNAAEFKKLSELSQKTRGLSFSAVFSIWSYANSGINPRAFYLGE